VPGVLRARGLIHPSPPRCLLLPSLFTVLLTQFCQ
jgi:hypothetical protein